MPQIIVNGKNLLDIAQEKTEQQKPTISQLQNDSNFVQPSGSVRSVQIATNTTNITGSSGTSTGTFGPTGNVTVNRNSSGSIKVPYFSVNEQGLITSVTNRTLSITTGCSNCNQCSVYDSCSHCTDCINCVDCSRYSRCSDCDCDCQP